MPGVGKDCPCWNTNGTKQVGKFIGSNLTKYDMIDSTTEAKGAKALFLHPPLNVIGLGKHQGDHAVQMSQV